jgi:hypothetical protein
MKPVNSLKKTLGWENFHGGAVSFEQRDLIVKHLKDNIKRIAWLGEQNGVTVTFVLPIASATKRPLGNCSKSMSLCSHDIHRKAQRLEATNPKRARELYIEAWEHDTIPLRIPPSVQRDLKMFFEDNGLRYVNLPELVPKNKRLDLVEDTFFHDHVHFSKFGHQFVAEQLSKYLQ